MFSPVKSISEVEAWVIKAVEKATSIKPNDLKPVLSDFGWDGEEYIDTDDLQWHLDYLYDRGLINNDGLTEEGQAILTELTNSV